MSNVDVDLLFEMNKEVNGNYIVLEYKQNSIRTRVINLFVPNNQGTLEAVDNNIDRLKYKVHKYYTTYPHNLKLLKLKYEEITRHTRLVNSQEMERFLLWYSKNMYGLIKSRDIYNVITKDYKKIRRSKENIIEYYTETLQDKSVLDKFIQKCGLEKYNEIYKVLHTLMNEQSEINNIKIAYINEVKYYLDKCKNIMFMGKNYADVNSFCDTTGLPARTIGNMLCTYDTNFENIVYNYISNKTLSEKIASNFAKEYETIRVKINLGISIREAILNKSYIIKLDGVAYKSLNDLCKKHRLQVILVENALKNNISIKEIMQNKEKYEIQAVNKIGYKKQNKLMEEIEIWDKKYTSYKSIAGYYSIPVSQINYGLSIGATIEDIIFGLDRRKPTVADVEGNRFFCLQDLCKHHDRSYSGYTSQLCRDRERSNDLRLIHKDVINNRKYGEYAGGEKASWENNFRAFEMSHTKIIDSKGKEVWICKLCGQPVKRINQYNFNETVNRQNPGLYWCQNTSCIGRLSSIACSPDINLCVPKVVYLGKNMLNGKLNYKFTCTECNTDYVMNFLDIVEHKASHIR